MDPKPGLHLRSHYKFACTPVGAPPEAKASTESQRAAIERQQKEKADRRAALELKVQGNKDMLEHRVAEIKKSYRCGRDKCPDRGHYFWSRAGTQSESRSSALCFMAKAIDL